LHKAGLVGFLPEFSGLRSIEMTRVWLRSFEMIRVYKQINTSTHQHINPPAASKLAHSGKQINHTFYFILPFVPLTIKP
jgi:hypothetical protein